MSAELLRRSRRPIRLDIMIPHLHGLPTVLRQPSRTPASAPGGILVGTVITFQLGARCQGGAAVCGYDCCCAVTAKSQPNPAIRFPREACILACAAAEIATTGRESERAALT